MLRSVWIVVGALAAAATLGALRTDDDDLAIVAGTAGFVFWGVWTYGSLGVEVPTDSGGTVTFTEPAVTMLGIILALAPGYVALTGPIELFGEHRDAEVDDL